VQITETVPPEILFSDYVYFSSFSDTMLRSASDLAGRLITSRRLGPASLVIELASNDGYLLQNYTKAGIPVLGIEPAANVARVAQEERGVRTLCEFFGAELAQRLKADIGRADVIHANNVLAHVADLNGFVSGIATLLKDDGVAVIEAPYLKDMIAGVEFDTIYHEHLCYFSLTALNHLFQRHGLQIFDLEHLPIHGGSLRLFAAHANRHPALTNAVIETLAVEDKLGMSQLGYYLDFGSRVEKLRNDLLALLADLKSRGASIAVYGASAKGSTLLNYFAIKPGTLEYVVDRSTVKQGLYTPGSHLLIHAPKHLLETHPEYVLLLTWNFAEEILSQQTAYREAGGRFIIPIPELKVV
jgi:SAM-dependent methyltransferase